MLTKKRQGEIINKSPSTENVSWVTGNNIFFGYAALRETTKQTTFNSTFSLKLFFANFMLKAV